MNGLNLQQLLDMSHSPLQNYIVPGLESRLMAAQGNQGTVRLFVNSRHQHHHITPHSHRFDFQCLVLRGTVWNTTFSRLAAGASDAMTQAADQYTLSELEYLGNPGKYDKQQILTDWFITDVKTYRAGDWYGMKHDEVHSIRFSKDAVVLFFEGPQITNTTTVLEPHVNGQTVHTFSVEPWMFRHPQDVFA